MGEMQEKKSEKFSFEKELSPEEKINPFKKFKPSLEGKVAAILNERELVINIGTSKGVKQGMLFKVLAEKPIEIKDPETGVIIGQVDQEKVRVKVSEVQEHISICKTFKTFSVGGNLYRAVLDPPRTVVETFKVEDSSVSKLSKEENYVKVGDIVVQVMNSD